jgi:hypothetical protein
MKAMPTTAAHQPTPAREVSKSPPSSEHRHGELAGLTIWITLPTCTSGWKCYPARVCRIAARVPKLVGSGYAREQTSWLQIGDSDFGYRLSVDSLICFLTR